DINFELSANRNEAGEAKGNDISMKDELGLDVDNDSTWQMITVDLSEPFDGDNFNFNIFESLGFRSRGNASEFIVDEMHVILSGGYAMLADKPGFKLDGEFLTDENLVDPTIGPDNQATVRMITSGDADSVYFGDNAVYVNLTDDAEGKDRLEFKVAEDADLSFFNNGVLYFWIKLLAPVTDINFELSANRNEAGEAKGTDISMKDELGLDVDNDSTWQMIMVDLSEPVGGDNFNFNIFESMGFRSRGNASEFIIDEMYVKLTSPLERYAEPLSTVSTLDTLIVSVGTLDPVFSPDVTAYTMEADPGTTTVTVEATATDGNATVTGTGDVDVSSGSAQVTVTVTAEDGVSSTDYVVDITVSNTGIVEGSLNGIAVYPNPASEMIHINAGDNEVQLIELVNLLGQTVRSIIVDAKEVVMNVSDLHEGVYIVSFDGVPVKKILINR
ncbi:MAG: T9SS type A sorting domain-containing protein, partial [Bacteroidales bacterium]